MVNPSAVQEINTAETKMDQWKYKYNTVVKKWFTPVYDEAKWI